MPFWILNNSFSFLWTAVMQVDQHEVVLEDARIQMSTAKTKNTGKAYKLDTSDINVLHKAKICNDSFLSSDADRPATSATSTNDSEEDVDDAGT